MKRTKKGQAAAPYSLHDMSVNKFEPDGNKLNLKTQSGIIKTQSGILKTKYQHTQVDGYVEFNDVQWESSFVYIIDISAETGMYDGRKIKIKDFIAEYKEYGFSVMDEVYGNGHTKYSGYLLCNNTLSECIVEIYHKKDIVFVEM